MDTYRAITRTLLVFVLALAIAGTASAGSMFRRGSDRDKDSSSTATRKTDTKDSRDSKTSQNSSNSGRARDSRDSNQSKPSGQVPNATMHDRGTPDATPTYKQRDNNSRSRDDNRSRYDSNKNDSRYYRNDERNDYNYRDNRKDDHRYEHHPPSYRNGYYYYNNTSYVRAEFACKYGHWLFAYVPDQCVRSVYYYYDYFPYVSYDRVVYVNRPRITVVEVPVYRDYDHRQDSGYYLDNRYTDSLDRTLSDITCAWMTRDPDLISRHVQIGSRIDVVLDGNYVYSVEGDDYRYMTRDAILAASTISFGFDRIRSRGDDRIAAYGTHIFYARDGSIRTVYISYVLERRYGDWVIVEVGSTDRRPNW